MGTAVCLSIAILACIGICHVWTASLHGDNDGKVSSKYENHREKRFAITPYTAYRWTHEIVPWIFDPALDANGMWSVDRTIRHYEYWTCFRFPPWETNGQYMYDLGHGNKLRFTSNGGCWSYVGNIYFFSEQNLACCGMGVCPHEIGHALGLKHEQQRTDRDNHVRINDENLDFISRWSLGKYASDNIRAEFDLSSTMEYPIYAFSNNGQRTIYPFDPAEEYLFGYKNVISFYDMKGINTVHGCGASYCSDFITPTPTHDGYVALINGQCRVHCPEGLDPLTGCATVSKDCLAAPMAPVIPLTSKTTGTELTKSFVSTDSRYFIEHAGQVIGWKVFAPTSGTVKMVVYRQTLADFDNIEKYYVVGSNDVNVIGGQETLEFVAGGSEMDVLPGDLIGFYLTGATLNYDTCSSSNTWLETSSFPTTGTTLTMGAVGVDACRTYAVEALVVASGETTFEVGRSTLASGGSIGIPSGEGIFIRDTKMQVPTNGKITQWKVNIASPGTIGFFAFRETATDIMVVDYTPFDLGTGLQTIDVRDMEQMRVKKGDYIGFYGITATLNYDVCASGTSFLTTEFSNVPLSVMQPGNMPVFTNVGTDPCRIIPLVAVVQADTPGKELRIPSQWPAGSYGMPKTTGGCPAGFSTGSRQQNQAGNVNDVSEPFHMDSTHSSNSFTTNYCVMNEDPRPDQAVWGSGAYCINRYGGTCPDGFEQGSISWHDTGVTATGNLPDGTYTASETTFEYCCRNDGRVEETIYFPIDTEFMLFIDDTSTTCQKVNGMQYTIETYDLGVAIPAPVTSGLHPWIDITGSKTTLHLCYYVRSECDCGDVIDLSSINPSAVISSPNYPSNYNDNSECYWLIKAPEGGRINIYFDEFALGSGDELEHRKFYIGQIGKKYDGTSLRDRTLLSANHITMLSFKSDSNYGGQGFSATIEYVEDSDMCISSSDNGASYRGDVFYTESYATCLHWDEVSCDHGTYATLDRNDGLGSHNQCRNPGNGILPWCYTEADGCLREYCDVCHLIRPYDIFSDCAGRIAADPTYCSTYPLAHQECHNTCDFESQATQPASVSSCNVPLAPSDGEFSEPLDPSVTEYSVGHVVYIRCLMGPAYQESVCQPDGSWSNIGTACTACSDGWEQFNGNCYKGFRGLYNYEAAEDLCNSYGAIVSPAESQEEFDFIGELQTPTTSMWVGMTDLHTENVFYNSDGKLATFFYWKTTPVSDSKDCVFLQSNVEWRKMTEIYCTSLSQVVCRETPFVCPPGCVAQTGKCYTILNYYSTSWSTTQLLCGFFDSDIATVKNRMDEALVLDEMGNVDAWINVQYDTISGTWKFFGTDDLSYSNWGSHVPDINNCVYLEAASREWRTAPCTDSKYVACSSSALVCDNAFVDTNGICYKVLDATDSLPWAGADNLCDERSSFLAMPKSQQELDGIIQIALDNGISSTASIWLGLSDANIKGYWTWGDAVSFDWQNWGPGQPIYNPAPDTDCATVKLSTGKWYVDKCSGSNYYVCQGNEYTMVNCENKSPQCASELEINPDLCYNPATIPYAIAECALTCGFCTDSGIVPRIDCFESDFGEPVNAVRQTPTGDIIAGDNLLYQCEDDLVLVTGDLSRACRGDGQLSGTAPVCHE